ncbi:MAG: uL15 family ribosomal protein, partial [Geminicoccaceae bacterium]|nr:uL15 family ribosomal protein [Geminicoccaceae bacterium]
RRLPKRGFKNPGRLRFAVINLDTLEMAIETGKIEVGGTVDADLLVKVGVVRRALDGLRLLGRGELSKPVTIEVAGASASAVAAVEKVGGKVVISGGAAVVEG